MTIVQPVLFSHCSRSPTPLDALGPHPQALPPRAPRSAAAEGSRSLGPVQIGRPGLHGALDVAGPEFFARGTFEEGRQLRVRRKPERGDLFIVELGEQAL